MRRASEFAILRRTGVRIAGPRLGQGVVAGLSTEVILEKSGETYLGAAKSWEIYRGMLWCYKDLDDLYMVFIWFIMGNRSKNIQVIGEKQR